jgi:hypothetical protein
LGSEGVAGALFASAVATTAGVFAAGWRVAAGSGDTTDRVIAVGVDGAEAAV